MTAAEYIERARLDWDEAWFAKANHLRAHREQRAWHPFGTPDRIAQDLRDQRAYSRLVLAESMTRQRLASRMRMRGLVPLPSGLFEAAAQIRS